VGTLSSISLSPLFYVFSSRGLKENFDGKTVKVGWSIDVEG
jgi:hypothetical protein